MARSAKFSVFRCGQMAAQVRGHDKDYPERLAHLKVGSMTMKRLRAEALVLVQGIQTAQNLEYLTLCASRPSTALHRSHFRCKQRP